MSVLVGRLLGSIPADEFAPEWIAFVWAETGRGLRTYYVKDSQVVCRGDYWIGRVAVGKAGSPLWVTGVFQKHGWPVTYNSYAWIWYDTPAQCPHLLILLRMSGSPVVLSILGAILKREDTSVRLTGAEVPEV